jgi:hypothetical protein
MVLQRFHACRSQELSNRFVLSIRSDTHARKSNFYPITPYMVFQRIEGNWILRPMGKTRGDGLTCTHYPTQPPTTPPAKTPAHLSAVRKEKPVLEVGFGLFPHL